MSTSAIASRSARESRLIRSPRFRDGKFHNTIPISMMKQPFTAGMAYEQLSGMGKRAPAHPLPMFGDTVGALARAPSETLRVTWLGHSTVLIEIDGVRLLTDPVFGERASPVSFAGPRRFHQVPLSLAELGRIDAVVLSHDHYDHLCAPTVRALAAGAVAGFSGRFVTALGVGAHLEKLGVMPEHITELDWGDGHTVTGAVGATVDVVAVPAQHFSGRGALDRNATLWAGMCMLGPRHRVFFSGDTGATSEHADIGASFGPFDIALFEIGAFHPAWGDIHLGPDGAFDAFARINARALLPVHWSTFDLGLHPWQEPAERLYTRTRREHAALLTPRLGEPLERDSLTTPWWREVMARRS